MKLIFTSLICSGLMILSTNVLAGTRLTAAQCNDYPFTPLKGKVTRAQLVQVLAELESVGYDPGAVSGYYPLDLQRAQSRLRAKYARECTDSPKHIKAQSSQ
ncbi:DUF4148 domain-containing protein [Pararobbsia alpina]|uniref:DUF4148 domain-containing protein n=1 Tax=Pararobbsia alpina TaxID=621374 RepID=A0A6S7AXU4_9BURK|nr:DUF4148 domain-containing protein [Pararobbsia alpina]CAB3781220.1 hypothetical protein LMG28138_01147 [Pararobbsia alpina]